LELFLLEKWKDIKGYEGYYQVSTLGRVRSLDRLIYSKDGHSPYMINGHIMCDGTSTGGYRMITLSKKGNKRIFHVHRLVASAFIPNPYNKETVNHKDECVTNNKVENLEWMTQAENNAYGTRLYRQKTNPNVVGHRINLTKEELSNELVNTTYCEIANKYGVSKRTIIKYAKDFNISKHSLLGTRNMNNKKFNISKETLTGMLDSGFSTIKIASIYGVDSHTIIKYKKKFNLMDCDRNKEKEHKIYNLVESGYNISQIAKITGFSRHKISNFINKNELKVCKGKNTYKFC